MPYQAGNRLSGETASKLGHLDVLNSDFVNQIINDFEKPELDENDYTVSNWEEFNSDAKPLKYIFAVDGSLQNLKSESIPKREVSFVKTALLHLDPNKISKIDPEYPHPIALQKVMKDTALYHATVFPLKHIHIKNSEWLTGLRKLIFDSFKDPTLDSEPYETLKWILYQKWENTHNDSPSFECPECNSPQNGMPYNSDEVVCSNCGKIIYSTDILGLHMEMTEDSASEALATSYMLLHETMMLFTAIRFFWENNNYKVLENTLFLKDGPLTLRSQYSKIVPNIRNLFVFLKSKNISIHLCGQEKTGKFVDYLEGISRFITPLNKNDSPHLAILSHNFIRKEIQRVRERGNINPYGYRTNYGEKILFKQSSHHQIVLNIPTGGYIDDDDKPNEMGDFIGIERILATIPELISYRHEGALVPIELVNGIASLSSYPSAKVLKLFSGIE